MWVSLCGLCGLYKANGIVTCYYRYWSDWCSHTLSSVCKFQCKDMHLFLNKTIFRQKNNEKVVCSCVTLVGQEVIDDAAEDNGQDVK